MQITEILTENLLITVITTLGAGIAGLWGWRTTRKEKAKDGKMDKIIDMIAGNTTRIENVDKKVDDLSCKVEELQYKVDKGRLARIVIKELTEINTQGIAYGYDEKIQKHLLMKFKNYIPVVEHVLTYYESMGDANDEFLALMTSRVDVIERESRLDGMFDFYQRSHTDIKPHMMKGFEGVLEVINDKVSNNKIPRMGKYFCDYRRNVCKITNKKYNEWLRDSLSDKKPTECAVSQ